MSLSGGVSDCEKRAQGGGAILRVALRSERGSSERPYSSIVSGDTIAVVHLRPGEPTTLTAARAATIVEAFRQAWKGKTGPVVSPSIDLALPPPPSRLQCIPFDILFFHDLDRNLRWDDREPYMTAWSGGRGSYRLIYLAARGSETAGARPGWNLLEGGEPPSYHPDLDRFIVYIKPVIEAIERR